MHKTFCPAKWDELFVNPGNNFVYACCKSVPVKFVNKEHIATVLDKQKNNLINGIQDPSCDYCWKLENQGFASKRQTFLSNFTGSIDDYAKNNPKANRVEINLGNECNFQCVYCNPKFSSQWETDVKNKPYRIFSDKDFYGVDIKNTKNLHSMINWIISYNNIDTLAVLGGEPLLHKDFFKLVENVSSKHLSLATNLSCTTTKPIDRLLTLANNYESIEIIVSLDCTEKLAEFTRYGMNYQKMIKNIDYLLTNCPENVNIVIASLMTSISILDLKNFILVVENFYNKYPKLKWNIEYCRDPKILTLNTLRDKDKTEAITSVQQIQGKPWIVGTDMLIGALQTSTFNKTLYAQMKIFLEEFSSRKGLDLPISL